MWVYGKGHKGVSFCVGRCVLKGDGDGGWPCASLMGEDRLHREFHQTTGDREHGYRITTDQLLLIKIDFQVPRARTKINSDSFILFLNVTRSFPYESPFIVYNRVIRQTKVIDMSHSTSLESLKGK